MKLRNYFLSNKLYKYHRDLNQILQVHQDERIANFKGRVKNIRNLHLENFEEGKDILNGDSKELIVNIFIGQTGAGKSTLLNLLQGQNASVSIDKYNHMRLNFPKDEKTLRVGHTMGSCTEIPSLFEINGMIFCDTTGFNDTKESPILLKSSFCLNYLFQIIDKIRGIFVMNGEIGQSDKIDYFQAYIYLSNLSPFLMIKIKL